MISWLVFLVLLLLSMRFINQTSEAIAQHDDWITYLVEENAELRQVVDNLEALRAQDQEVLNSLGDFLLEAKPGTFELTAYTPWCGNGDGVTSIGVTPTVGRTIAVDPSVIPYGSLAFVEGFGWRTAEDTGGAIKGKKLDLFVSSYDEAYSIGRPQVRVLVIPKEEDE